MNPQTDIQNRWVSEKEEWGSIRELLIYLKHKKEYQFASEYCTAKYVLDYGCGSGYGSRLLASKASQVIGVDTSEEVINYCTSTYRAPNLSFQKIHPNCSLPFDDNLFDVIVSFHVVEHIRDVPTYLFQLKRVLKSGGVLFITTPSRKHRLLPFQRPWNPEHVREYDQKGLNKELKHAFKKVKILGVYGTDEINAIEYRLVKQTPFRAYVYQPGITVLKAALPPLVVSVLRNLRQRAYSQAGDVRHSPLDSHLLDKYSADDFTVRDDLGGCLDLLAVCHKES